MALAGCPSGIAYDDEVRGLRALNAQLLGACQAMLDQLEDAMAGEINEHGQHWVTGQTNLQLRPDGSYMLSHVRAVVAKATDAVEKSNGYR